MRDYSKGVYISAGKTYYGNDFVDTQRSDIYVDVAGGLCKKNMGVAHLEIKVLGCDWVQPATQVSLVCVAANKSFESKLTRAFLASEGRPGSP